MVITPHALVGAALGRLSPSVPVAFAAGVASHYALDAIPHDDYSPEGVGGRVALTIDFALALRLLAGERAARRELAGALGGITPDLLHQVYVRWPTDLPGEVFLRLHEAWHSFIHAAAPPRPPRGLVSQIAAGAVGLMLLRALSR